MIDDKRKDHIASAASCRLPSTGLAVQELLHAIYF